jgi:tetratricopeptide (TPR) repeat protein
MNLPESEKMQQRVIRVFVSSTFKDMQTERDYLVKFIFPELRKLCELRGVTWGEVDLRWGIPDEQKAEGKVLPICLQEIDRCRPYFIGLLGERYGWVPDEIMPELIAREPWLSEYRQHSVTELEILHGVLSNPTLANHAFFYFRDPKYIETLPIEKQIDYISENPQSIEKLNNLKERIRNSSFPVQENYANPKALGELVRKDLTEVINRLFPEDQKPDPLDREATDHEDFAKSRAEVYIGRQEYFSRLDAHVLDNGLPLVVLGESGIGKSALLSNWYLHYRKEHPHDLILIHFVSANPNSADWEILVRRIMAEFKRRFGLEGDIPDRPVMLRQAFANWLHMAAAKKRVVLIIDSLNQLEDKEGAPDLVWLPPVIPAAIRLILSTLPGRSLDELTKRVWQTLTIPSLTQDERAIFIDNYLAQYRKSLDKEHCLRIAESPQTANPLYLKVLLEELRLFGVHEKLDEHINYYLKAGTIPDLYSSILKRWENDYDSEKQGLVRNAMSLLWAARSGLSEMELLEMLGENDSILPHALWSPLFLAAGDSLLNRAGLLTFSHDYLRTAVKSAYFPSEEQERTRHKKISEYFFKKELGPRKIDELPWQLHESEDWSSLNSLLSDTEFFNSAYEHMESEVKKYWATLESRSEYRMTESYCQPQNIMKENPRFLWNASRLFASTGKTDNAINMLKSLTRNYRQIGEYMKLTECLLYYAQLVREHGSPMHAIELFRESERLSRQTGYADGLLQSLSGKADIYVMLGDFQPAYDIYIKCGAEFKLNNNTRKFAGTLKGMAGIYLALKDYDTTLQIEIQIERLFRELSDQAEIAYSRINQADLLYVKGDTNAAKEMYKESEAVFRMLGEKDGIGRSLGKKGIILESVKKYEEALALYNATENIFRESGNGLLLVDSLSAQIRVLKAMENFPKAIVILEDLKHICKRRGFLGELQKTLKDLTILNAITGNHFTASIYKIEEELLTRELEKKQKQIGNSGSKHAAIPLSNELNELLS